MTHAAANGSQAGLIIREREPVNLESPFDQLNGRLTPNELFYVRSHFHAPQLDRESYRLSITGAVQHPFELTYADLLDLPTVTRTATLECAGNSRIFLIPQVEGAQWQSGAVSTAEWTGVPLAALLDRAGLQPGACEILFEGADHGTPKEKPTPPREIAFSRSLSVEKARDVVLAYRMNGEDLALDHGFPLRAIVPGFYGMASVKWLTRIRALTQPFRGYFQTSDYAYWDFRDGDSVPERIPLGPMSLKSAIARPRLREVLPAGQTYTVAGAAWSGGAPVDKVEVSTDDGKTWQPAQFLDPPQHGVWRRWTFAWQAPSQPGIFVLRSRATDAEGNTQPEQHDKRFGSYAIHHVLPIEVSVH